MEEIGTDEPSRHRWELGPEECVDQKRMIDGMKHDVDSEDSIMYIGISDCDFLKKKTRNVECSTDKSSLVTID